ncbi:MAG: beta-Ig-H3/fasciclin [Aphanizomenon flos-aquae MDT14a]|nr:MAG: beta-Ig-H3/fasciclin [Aphanizomenon flos-aquae MDT14a]
MRTKKLITCNYSKLLFRIVSIMGLTSFGMLINIPSPAEETLKPRPSIFNQDPYNSHGKPSQKLPITKPIKPVIEVPSVKPTPTTPVTETTENKNLIVLANADGSFTILIKALTAAGLTETLQGAGPFTIFAPTDAAFAKLKDETAVEDLLKPENKNILIQVLKYHVVPGKILFSDLKSGKVKSLQGDDIIVTINNNIVKVDNAKITEANIQGSNGIIYKIDHLLVPPNL